MRPPRALVAGQEGGALRIAAPVPRPRGVGGTLKVGNRASSTP